MRIRTVFINPVTYVYLVIYIIKNIKDTILINMSLKILLNISMIVDGMDQNNTNIPSLVWVTNK